MERESKTFGNYHDGMLEVFVETNGKIGFAIADPDDTAVYLTDEELKELADFVAEHLLSATT